MGTDEADHIRKIRLERSEVAVGSLRDHKKFCIDAKIGKFVRILDGHDVVLFTVHEKKGRGHVRDA